MNDNAVRLYPLTHPQKRVWYTEKIFPDTPVSNIGGSVRIKGPVNFKLLEEAINIFIKTNEGLRIQFIEQNGEIKQYVRKAGKIKIDFFDFSLYDNPFGQLNQWVRMEAAKPFQIQNERLFYFAMFRVNENDNGYFAKFHHIISDGWSISIMQESINRIYSKLLNGEEVCEEDRYSYLEYIEKEQGYLNSARFVSDGEFWNKKFAVLAEISPDAKSDGIEGRRKEFCLDETKTNQLKEFVSQNRLSINTFFVGLVLIYLYRVYQKDDVVIGTPVLNRSGVKEKNIFGMFTSTMPFRMNVCGEDTARAFLGQVSSELRSCYLHQRYPYNLLVRDLELKKKGHDSLFQICVNTYNTKLSCELNGACVENTEFYNGKQIYSLQVVVKELSDVGTLTLNLDYKVNEYTQTQIQEMYSCFYNIMDQILTYPEEKIDNLDMLPEKERYALLYEFNSTQTDYPVHKTVYELFEEQVERTPDKTAISFKNRELTYRELNEKANSIAGLLKNKGIGREEVVGIMALHSIETVIGILGIIKCGAAYLPIDPGYPADRINYMLENSRVHVLFVNFTVSQDIRFEGEIIDLNRCDLYRGEGTGLEVRNKPGDLVYVIYTSGSTGKPKGVMIEHGGLVNYIWWAKQAYVKQEDEAFPLYSSLAFDLTVTSIFTPLISGSKIVVYGEDETEYVLYRIMKENKVSVVKLTPSHLALLKDRDNRNSSVKRFIVGGEDLKVSLAADIHKSFGGKIEIYNEYGPTETVVGCMIHKYDFQKDTSISVPIGVPINNTQIYVLDRSMATLPVGSPGEIYISGDGVARGYMGRSDLTEERFINNPFMEGGRMYRTGDLARHIEGKGIEYLGRVDQQVKIHGYRIELGEIEKHLMAIENINHCVVIDCEDVNKEKYLCAYIVTKESIPADEIRRYLSKYLPGYMVPLYFVTMDKLPLTPNGKINRALLPEPRGSCHEERTIISGRNETEEQLLKAVGTVLNTWPTGIGENFYHIGGDSIKAIQVASKLNEVGLKIKVKDILSHPVLGEMAQLIEIDHGIGENQELSHGMAGCTPVIIWFLTQGFADINHWNQSVLLELEQDIRVETLEEVLDILIKHHDSLRLNFDLQQGMLFYNDAHLDRHSKIEELDLSSYSREEQDMKLKQAGEKIKSGIHIGKDILLRACLINMGPRGKRLLMTAHHLVVDGVSWRIILEDLASLCMQIEGNKKIALPRKTHSFQKWATGLEDYGRSNFLKEKLYWQWVVQDDFCFPVDFDLNQEDLLSSSETISRQLDIETTGNLLSCANIPYNVKPNELMVMSLALTVFQFTGKQEIVIELEGHGREDLNDDLDVSRTVGWFTSIYPVRLKGLSGTGLNGVDFDMQIKFLKEQLRCVPNHGVGFGFLKYQTEELTDNRQSQVRFNYLGDFSNSFGSGLFKPAREDSGPDCGTGNHMTCLLDIVAKVVGGEMDISVTYCRNKFKKETITSFLDKFTKLLKDMTDYCCHVNDIRFMPSDFDAVKVSQEELDNIFY